MKGSHYKEKDFKDFIFKRMKGLQILKFYEHIQECNQCLNHLRDKVAEHDQEVEKDVSVGQQHSTV